MTEAAGVTSPARLIYLVVLYGSSNDLAGLLRSLAEQKDLSGSRLYVIDNNLTRYESDKIKDFKFTNGMSLEVLHPGRNLGYFGAAQWAFKTQGISESPPEWLIVSNPDLVFKSQDLLERLSKFSGEAQLGVLAPQIISGLSGRDQNPYMIVRPTARSMRLRAQLFQNLTLAWFYQALSLAKSRLRSAGKSHATSSSPTQTTSPQTDPIYAAHGSCMIFSKNYFAKGGTLSHPCFLFAEEITVAENLRHLGLKTIYTPTIRLEHREHQITGRIPGREMRRYIAQASKYCADTYFAKD